MWQAAAGSARAATAVVRLRAVRASSPKTTAASDLIAFFRSRRLQTMHHVRLVELMEVVVVRGWPPLTQ